MICSINSSCRPEAMNCHSKQETMSPVKAMETSINQGAYHEVIRNTGHSMLGLILRIGITEFQVVSGPQNYNLSPGT